jgi:predicted nucleotidyltransferase
VPTTSSTEEIVDHIKTILNDECPVKIESAFLFGSRARGTETDQSDTDVLLISSDFEGEKQGMRGHWFKREWNNESFGPLDLLCYTESEVDERLENGHETIERVQEEGLRVDVSKPEQDEVNNHSDKET